MKLIRSKHHNNTTIITSTIKVKETNSRREVLKVTKSPKNKPKKVRVEKDSDFSATRKVREEQRKAMSLQRKELRTTKVMMMNSKLSNRRKGK